MPYLEENPKCKRCVGGADGIIMTYIRRTASSFDTYRCPICDDVYYYKPEPMTFEEALKILGMEGKFD